jgi:hypothetical protein
MRASHPRLATTGRLAAVPSRNIERRVDDALLATAIWASVLYVRRRLRRLYAQLAVSAAVAAAVTGVAAAGALAAWTRRRARRRIPA